MNEHFAYLAINLASLSVPLLRSFDKRVQYVKRWPYLFASMSIVGAVFLIWDIIFTHLGIWGFNPRYLSGISLFNLPLGEWLFFFVIPYSSIFIYEVFKYFTPWQRWSWGVKGASFLQWASWALAAFNYDKWYTVITFSLLGTFLWFAQNRLKLKWGLLWVSYAVALIPFFVVNGLLTGSWISEEIVWYNDAENLGIRLGTIPFEDVFYGMLLIFGNIALMEWLENRSNSKGASISHEDH